MALSETTAKDLARGIEMAATSFNEAVGQANRAGLIVNVTAHERGKLKVQVYWPLSGSSEA
jgi:hypothetical protein